MKLPEMPSYPYIGQDWDDTARLLLGDWGKACYVAGEKQERALWELTKAGEALGEPAATPVVPPSQQPSVNPVDAPAELSDAASEGHAQLMRFYAVETLSALIDAQGRHIERLQAKLPKPPSLAPTFPRG